jgi:hypothetical protein
MRYTDDDALPEITDEDLREAIGATKPYTIVVLKAGARYSPPGPDRDPNVERVVWAHGKRNYALRGAGLMPIVCPIADGSAVVGVSIFDADREEVERIMGRDPGVDAGIFTYDIHPTRSFPGSALPG